MTQDSSGVTQDLERYRPFLVLLARLHWEPSLRGKMDPSDLVQQTLLKAVQTHGQLRAPAGEAAWLRQILVRELADQLRRFHGGKRNLGAERSLDGALEQSSAKVEAWLAGDNTSPSDCAMREEELLRLSAALTALPEEQRQAIELHHFQGLTIPEVADEMQRSRAAAAGLLRRGLKTIREQLAPASDVVCLPTPQTESRDSTT